MSFVNRFKTWSATRDLAETERERLAQLNAPPPQNDPRLLKAVVVELLRPVRIDGRVARAGERVSVPAHLARDLVALKRAREV